MNKYTKNMIWFNIEKLICFTVALGFLILMIACITTSCSTSHELAKHSKEYPCVFTN